MVSRRHGRRYDLGILEVWKGTEGVAVGCSATSMRSHSSRGLTNYASEYAREKMWARIHLVPLLQAEEDRDLVRKVYADKARENELFGHEYKTYHSDRYKSSTGNSSWASLTTNRFVRPTFAITPDHVTK